MREMSSFIWNYPSKLISANYSRRQSLVFCNTDSANIKSILWPDWICMRVVPLYRPWTKHQTLSVYDFLMSDFNIWKDFKVLSRFIQKWNQPPSCSDHCSYRILSSNWLACVNLLKKSTKGLHYFGLGYRTLEYCTHEP
jgi:hypothetical protein